MNGAVLFVSKVGRTMVSIDLAPHGDGSRAVTVWTWDDGPYPTQHRPFIVPSLEAARVSVPAGALRMLDAKAAAFAEEVWIWSEAAPFEVTEFGTEPTVIDAAMDLRVRS